MPSLISSLERSPIVEPKSFGVIAVANARRDVADVFHRYGIGVPSWIIRKDSTEKLALSGHGLAHVAGLTLTPATMGTATTCQNFRHCADLCVLTHGRGAFATVRNARDARVAALLERPDAMGVLMAHDVDRLGRTSGGDVWALRLNVASDIAWEVAAPWLIRRAFERGAVVYDYTKRWTRDREPVQGYRLTFSAAGHSIPRIRERVQAGGNVAVVFPVAKGEPVPTVWHGLPVIDGDRHDVRYIDPAGVVVALRAKGKAIHSHGSGLIYRLEDPAPIDRECAACGAESGEVCRPMCIARVA